MTAYNQAGALVHIYTDGSVQLNHGGTEMGQGLFIKVAQVVAAGVPGRRRRASASPPTTTGKVPNTSATAASSGSDLNGMAAQAAARTLKERLIAFAAEIDQAPARGRRVRCPAACASATTEMTFEELVKRAYFARVPLSATGFYKTPDIHWDRAAGKGRPFYYFAYGAACSEVLIDTLTGEYRVERVDILHDCRPLAEPGGRHGPDRGRLRPGHGLADHRGAVVGRRGPAAHPRPLDLQDPLLLRPAEGLRTSTCWDGENREATIYRSKAVGEPPLMLGISVFHALSDAVASVADHRVCPQLDAPATPERVLLAVERLRAEAGR